VDQEHHQHTAGTRWKAAPDVVARRVRGEVLLVPIRKTSGDLDGFFTLNATAAEIWDGATQGRSSAELVSALARSYAVDEAEAEADVRRVTDELVSIGALQRVT